MIHFSTGPTLQKAEDGGRSSHPLSKSNRTICQRFGRDAAGKVSFPNSPDCDVRTPVLTMYGPNSFVTHISKLMPYHIVSYQIIFGNHARHLLVN